jgi:hypothetical protein
MTITEFRARLASAAAADQGTLPEAYRALVRRPDLRHGRASFGDWAVWPPSASR